MNTSRTPMIALVCGVLAVVAAFLIFWMVLISVGLGAAAIVLGVRIRRSTNELRIREMAVAAIVLGIIGIVGTGGSWLVSAQGEDYGRDCALDPTEDC